MKLKSAIVTSLALVAWACAALAIVGPAQGDDTAPRAKPPAASEKGSSLDDELLKQLDDSLDGSPAAKHDHDHEPDGPDAGAVPSEKPAPPRAAPAPGKRPAKPSTDEELLQQLDAQDDPSTGPSKEKPGDELGQKADPLTRIGTKMRQAVTLIDRDKLSEKTTSLQDEIVKDIDELIKQQKKKMQQQQQSSSQSKKDQQSSRSSVKPQGKQAQQKQSQKPGGSGDQESKQPKESDESLRKNEQKTVKLDPAAQDELLKRVWGLLPEKDREQMRQAAGDESLPEYESLIIRYFRRLAEEESSQP